MNHRKIAATTATAAVAVLVLASILPGQGAISFGTVWRDINPTQYAVDVTGTLRGVYVRNGGTGSIGAGDGWAVGGDAGNPLISHYDGFSWRIMNSPVSNAVWNGVHFCTSPGAPGVGLCSPNGDGSDGWIVGTAGGSAKALYWDGSALTDVSTGLTTYGAANLTSVFLVCHSPPSGTGCPGAVSSTGLAYAVGSAGGQGAIFAFNGNPKGAGGWTPQTITGTSTSQYNGVYMYLDQSGALAGFAVGNGGIVARLNGGTWTASQIDPGANDLQAVFVDQGNPADAWAVGKGGQIWHFTTGIWTGYVSPKGTTNDLFGIFLTSTSEGWIVGNAGTILHSTNLGSGNVWTALTSPIQTAVGAGIVLLGASFPSGGNGWAVGTQGVILHTENSGCGSAVPSPCWGGSTSITQVTAGQQLNAVFMKGSNDAWAGGSWDTTSGNPSLIHWDGNKWHRASVSPAHVSQPDIFGIYMLSSGEGWAVGGDPTTGTPEALKWSGSTWTGQPIVSCGYCSALPLAVFMVSGGTGGDGWAVGTAGTIWRYQSGSWGIQSTPTTNNLNGVFISNPGSNTNAGWAVGDSGTVLKLQIVGGTPTWILIGIPGITTQNLYGVFFTDSNHGFIVGSSATIVQTMDGGASWSGGPNAVTLGPPLPATTNLRSVYINTFGIGSGNGDGWAVGDDGTAAANAVFAHWDGAGWTNWPLIPPLASSPFGLGLRSVYMTSPDDGFAVGAGVAGATAPLSGIFHLDPPNLPIQIVATSTGVTTSVGGGTTSTGAITATITSTTTGPTTATTATGSTTTGEGGTTTQESTMSSETQGTSVQSETSSASTGTPLELPAIPGFPWESVMAGIIAGLAVLGIARRHRRTKTQ